MANSDEISIGDFLGDMILAKVQGPSSLTDEKRLYYTTRPVEFARDILGVDTWEKQEEILNSVLTNKRVAVRSCHGAGKTFTASVVVLWFLICYQPSTVVTTAPTARQVKSILWEEIRLRHKQAKTNLGGRLLQMELQMGPKWLATGFATDEYNVERFQGYHNENILVVIDEACFDDQTEVLTNEGWKFFAALNGSEAMLTMCPETGKATYRKPTKLFQYDHDGDMIELNQRGCSFKVTPNHRLLIKKRRMPWKFEEVRNLKAEYCMSRKVEWSGSTIKYFELPFTRTSRKRWNIKKIPINDWANFLGWYLSEGTCSNDGYSVTISQKDPSKCSLIAESIRTIGYKPKVYGNQNKGYQFRIQSNQLNNVLKEYGTDSLTKKVPDYIKQAPVETIRIFLKAYVNGDGYYRGSTRAIYYTSSKQMADDLQELILKAGYGSSVHKRLKTRNFLDNHCVEGTVDGYVINQTTFDRQIKVKVENQKRVHYKGKVYCAEIPPFHTMLVRRNGYVMWSGNSGVARNIFTGVEGLLSSGNAHLLLIGNPTDELSEFGHSFKSPLYKKMHISAFDTPNLKEGKTVRPYLVTPEWVAERKTEWGENDPLYEVRVMGNFPTTSEGALIPLAWVERARASTIKPEGIRVLGVDIARLGGDESVAYMREGDSVIAMWKWLGNDLMESTGKIARLITDHTPSRVNIDAVGVGAGVYDRLIELGYDVYAINGSERAFQSDRYQNLRTEIMWNLKSRFENSCIRIPDDDKLEHQLVNLRQQSLSSRGQLRLEAKEDMKARIGTSPDRADALALAFWEQGRQKTALIGSAADFTAPAEVHPEHVLEKIGKQIVMTTSPTQMMYNRLANVSIHECSNCHAQGHAVISWSNNSGNVLSPAEATQGRCLICGFVFEVQH